MSADNGIYVLETGAGDKKEYRVRELQAIENLEFDPTVGKEVGSPDVRIKNARRMWSGCDVFPTEDAALEEAERQFKEILKSDYPVLKYGINVIRIERDF